MDFNRHDLRSEPIRRLTRAIRRNWSDSERDFRRRLARSRWELMLRILTQSPMTRG